MRSMNPNEIPNYRVEWRPDLTTGWLYLRPADTHDEAHVEADDALKEYKGQVRIVSQHVTEVKGICSKGWPDAD